MAEDNPLFHVFDCFIGIAHGKQWNGSLDAKEQKTLVPNTTGMESS